MKHPCPQCGRVIDDGLPCPPGINPENLRRSHKYCPDCIRIIEAELEEILKLLRDARRAGKNKSGS